MPILAKQEAEIPLNGGMDDQAGAEYQAVTTLRAVTDLRMNNGGEWEKRPATASTQAIVNPGSVGVYAGLGGAGVVESRGEVYALTDHYGPMNESGRNVAGGIGAVGTSTPYDPNYTHVRSSVSRRQVVSANMDNGDQGILACASCQYSTDTLVTATVIAIAAGSGSRLILRAHRMSTGAILAQAQYADDVAASTAWAVDACENTDATAPGAVVTFASGPGPYTIRKYRYLASTQTFASDGDLVAADVSWVHHRIKTSPTAAGRFLLAYNATSTGFLAARDVTATTGATVTSHAGTHAASAGADFAISGSRVCIVSLSTYGASPVLYAETFGVPANVITVKSYGGTFYGAAITAATETASSNAYRAVAFVSLVVDAAGVAPTWVLSEAVCVNFAADPCVSISTDSLNLRNVILVGHAATVDGRAYATFDERAGSSLAIVAISPPNGSAIVCRYDSKWSGGSPSIEPVARVCHDRYARQAALPIISSAFASMWPDGNKLRACFLSDASADAYPSSGIQCATTVQLSTIDLTPRPVVSARNAGVATMSGGILADLDGEAATLSQPQFRPVVYLDTATAGSTSAATWIKVIAVYAWIDAAGRLHRSAPSEAQSTGIFTTQQLDVYVTDPPFTPVGTNARKVSVEIYATTDGGATYYRCADAGSEIVVGYTYGNGYRVFADVLAGSSAYPPLYTTGAPNEELTSEPPPAFKAIATIGDRMWGIDAEDASRVWYSKPFAAGFAVEWNTVCTLLIGSDAEAVADVGGIPTVFSRDGIWQVYGEGPNALGVGSFAPARRLPHEVACIDALSVCKTPVGVVFRSRAGVVMLGNDLSLVDIGAPLASLSVSGTPTGYCKIAYDELSDELHVLDFDSVHYVLNMGEGKWSKWTQSSSFQNWADCVCVNGRMWFLQLGSSVTDSLCRLKAIDEADHNLHTGGWSIQTPWIRFDGVTGDMRVRECIPQIRLGSAVANTGTVTAIYETRENETDTFVFTAADIIALGSAGKTVNLRCPIRYQQTRQFRITLTEGTPGAATAGHVPVGMRVLYGITPGGQRNKSTTQNKGGT